MRCAAGVLHRSMQEQRRLCQRPLWVGSACAAPAFTFCSEREYQVYNRTQFSEIYPEIRRWRE
jgi:hypothetical protein